MKLCKYLEDFKYKYSEVHFHMHASAYTLHYHDYFEFFFVLSGTSSQKILGKTYTLSKGDAFLIFPENYHQVFSNNSEDYKLANIKITENKLKELCDVIDSNLYKTLCSNRLPIKLSLDSKEMTYYADIIHDMQLTNNNEESFVSFVKLMWINTIKLLYQKSLHIDTRRPEWLNDFLAQLHNQNTMLLPVNELYKLTYFSHSHFNRVFKKYIGKSLKEYLIDLKMDYAANLLEQTDLKITNIVALTGYSSISHFNYTFKNRFGKNPTEYKKRFN